MKRAQSISLQTIVVAVLCIVVLIILIFVFRSKMGDWANNTKSCELKGGTCGSPCDPIKDVEIKNTDCAQSCCARGSMFETKDTNSVPDTKKTPDTKKSGP
jgi:hypothetical protein